MGIDKADILVLARGALGDGIITIPLLTALAKKYRTSRIVLAGNPGGLAVMAGLPFVSGIIDHNRAEWSGLYIHQPRIPNGFKEFLLDVKMAAVLAPGQEDPLVDGLKALGVKQVFAVPSRPSQDRPIHLSDCQLAALGLDRPEGIPLLRPSLDGLADANEFLKENNLSNQPLASFHPGSGSEAKNWPLESWP